MPTVRTKLTVSQSLAHAEVIVHRAPTSGLCSQTPRLTSLPIPRRGLRSSKGRERETFYKNRIHAPLSSPLHSDIDINIDIDIIPSPPSAAPPFLSFLLHLSSGCRTTQRGFTSDGVQPRYGPRTTICLSRFSSTQTQLAFFLEDHTHKPLQHGQYGRNGQRGAALGLALAILLFIFF